MAKILRWLMTTRLYAFIMRHIVWRIRFSTTPSRFNSEKFAGLQASALPGRFLLTVDDRKLTTFLIPGITSHAAYVSDSCVIDMINSGLRKSQLFDQAQESDRIIVMDCLLWDDEYKRTMMNYANSIASKPVRYDISFTLGIEELYCSELIYKLDFEQRLNCDLSDLVGMNKPYISPDGLLFAEHAVCVWDSDGVFSGMTGPDIEAMVMNEKITRANNRRL
jgi:hypothetical protein